jgi:diguanylate cyclase (GGDEF)-like protein
MEAHLQWVRAVIVIINAVLFLVSFGSEAPTYRGALVIIVLSAAYSAALLAFKPYLRWPLLTASLFTTLTDSVFVTLWVMLTGGPDSPYYLLYHVSVAAIAIRFSLRESLFAAAAYSASYAILVVATASDLPAMIMPLVIRTSYMWFIGLIVGRLASEERDRAGETREILRLHEELAHAQRALEVQALHDALTGLPNRRRFDTCLAEGVQTARLEQHHLALLIVDLDGFKEVNDTFGHAAGDELLVQVAQRLRDAVRGHDVVARLGGDEFALVLGSASLAEAEAAAQRVLDALARPVLIDGQSIATGGSVGIAMHPLDGDEPAALLRRADLAMYAAKRGRAGYADSPLSFQLQLIADN